MAAASSDQNLLFGILALQVNFITRDALLKGMNAWVLEKHRALGLILVEQGGLSQLHCDLLEAMVREHLRVHDNDPRKSLAAISSVQSVHQDLRQVADPELQASVGHLGGGGDVWKTAASVAEPSSSASRYRKLRAHARGGLGEVFVAVDEELKREVALKEIQDRHADNGDSRARFVLEAEITGKLEHPGIVPVHGLGHYPDGRPFYAMRFIKGDSLGEAIDRFHKQRFSSPSQREIELRQLLGRFTDVCDAIAYAHSRGVLHRDLKPGNVMLGRYGETLVVDWGLAKLLGSSGGSTEEQILEAASGSGTAPTQMGKAVGTPEYMSPEQAAGRLDELGPASDVYSLGATLYCLLAGKAPFKRSEGSGLGELYRKVERGEFSPPRQVNTQAPRALEAVCLKAMATNPQDRYPSPEDLAKDVQRWLADLPTTAYPEPLRQRLGRWVRRHQTKVAAGVVLLLTAAVGLGVGGLLLSESYKRENAAQQDKLNANAEKERARHEATLAQVDQLRQADTGAVPTILANLDTVRDALRPRLRELWDQKGSGEKRKERMRVGLALLPSDPEAVKDTLLAWMLDNENDPPELILTRNVLAPYGEEFKQRLWAKVDDPQVGFRALVGLAAFDPDSPRWPAAAPRTLEPWLRENPLYVGVLTEALRPIKKHLIGPLLEVATDAQGKLADKRFEAASVLTDYAADQPETLVNLLAESDERQFVLVFPRVQALGGAALIPLRQEMERGRPWYRPLVPDTERDRQASRQANVAIALMRLGQAEEVWPLLTLSPDPTRRTWLALRMASRGVPASILLDRLLSEPEISQRRALLSALGEYDDRALPVEERNRVVPRLLTWYRDDADPGLHGAIDWLLRQNMDGPLPRKLDWGLVKEIAAIDAERRGQPLEGRRWSINAQGQTLVHFVGPMEFWMGSPTWQTDNIQPNELLHRRRIERSFAIASKKVTRHEFEMFQKAYPEQEKYGPDPDCPVFGLDWYDAAMYCRWLSEQDPTIGKEDMCYPPVEEIRKCRAKQTAVPLPKDYLSRKGYRLPTEGEWEYACRATTTTAHWYGGGDEELLGVHAWYLKNARERSWPVGQKRPNDFGLFDMHGNAWDWTPNPAVLYQAGPGGVVLDKEDNKDIDYNNNRRALRGGSFSDPASYVRSADRSFYAPSNRYDINGLRVARTL